MKLPISVLLIFCTTCGLLAQKNTAGPSITFKACKVEKATHHLKTKPYRDVIIGKTVTQANAKDRSKAIQSDTSLSHMDKWRLIDDHNYHPEGIPNRVIESYAIRDIELVETDLHPFVAAVHTAYAYHFPLEISPDMVWLLIAQGFATHINENAEALRAQFVDFDGKKNIDIRRDHFQKGRVENDWEGVFPEFCDKIGNHVGDELTTLVTTEFSTTTIVEKAAFQVTLMDAMEAYFTYSVTTACGIPEITLTGTKEDWESIKERAQLLAPYELDWWLDDLLPILDEFSNAAGGKVKAKFWKSIYKLTGLGSGNPYVSGWFAKLFPYLKYGNTYTKNPSLNPDQNPDFNEEEVWRSIETDNFPSGLSQVDFIWRYFNDSYKMEFVAGFIGFAQDEETLTLRPEINWAVVDKNMAVTEEEKEVIEKGGDKEYLNSRKKN